jgi:cellulose synthase/poly-beta-1,6-N-acetylglucosamine synthase-like glycosyltransferase
MCIFRYTTGPVIAAANGARVIAVNHRQIAATRNSGARSAQGSILIFVDADTLVSKDAIHATIDAVRNGAIGGGCAFRFYGRLPL